ncbi:hypothetical protein EMA8858_01603 [Emticicia aquatica]|jgi:hypothetical protein|uniref:GtrA family protein n=1 Tax=Emticicia aquatica TaxID=1681835 RepID=A0ABN8EVD1_9BACT|nr:hypothetical protein [Emticicia aquatica]CAH0995480.1 hypothetical protein EMA8858_01603 [Emticicia aquatica]
MKKKWVEWAKRYMPAGIISSTATILSSVFTYKITLNHLTSALVGTWVGNIVYFGYMLGKDIFDTQKRLAQKNIQYSIKTFMQNIRALVVEFGFSELFDSFLIRPTLMYYFPIWVDDIWLGIILAKVVADITFYVPAIISYEYSKKKLRSFN